MKRIKLMAVAIVLGLQLMMAQGFKNPYYLDSMPIQVCVVLAMTSIS